MRSSPSPFPISERELDEKLELLQQLCLEDEAQRCGQSDYDWTKDGYGDHVPFGYEEYDADACEACVYDPYLFSPSSPTRARAYSFGRPNRDKPLPAPPPTPIFAHTPYTTPLSSPRADSFTCSSPSSVPSLSRSSSIRSRPTNRSRTPSFSSGSRSPYTHSTLPSISSTLSHLEEQDFLFEKSHSMWVKESRFPPDDLRSESSQESTVLAHAPIRKSSRDLQLNSPFPSESGGVILQRKSRPTTPSLTTSVSSPALRNLAVLASTPASPIRTVAPPSAFPTAPRYSTHQPSRSNTLPLSLLTDLSLTPFQSTTQPSEPNPMLASRWSLDTTAPPSEVNRRVENAAEPTTTLEAPHSPKTKKRDRLLSFISRSRAGSVGKSSTPASGSETTHVEPDPESATSSRRSSRFTGVQSPSAISLPLPAHARPDSTCPPPLPISTASSSSNSVSPASTTTSCSVSTIATPIDGDGNSSDEDHGLPNVPESTSYYTDEYDDMPPSPPLLPLPDPNTPAVSFLYPPRPTTNIPFLSTLSLRRKARRRRQLVISDASFLRPLPPLTPEIAQDARAMIDRERREKECLRRRDAITEWCKKFGPLRRVDLKPDGSMVVSWKNWDSADQACRVQAQVSIRGVGTVSLAWRYVK